MNVDTSGEQKPLEDTADHRGGRPLLRVYSRPTGFFEARHSTAGCERVLGPGQPALFHLGEIVWPNFGKWMGFMWNPRLRILYAVEYNSATRKNEMIPIVAEMDAFRDSPR